MSLAARCPHCETVFRLQESHLAAARGWVRCGACQRTFDAVVNLVERADAPPPALQALPDIDLDLPDLGAFDSRLSTDLGTAIDTPQNHPGPPEPQGLQGLTAPAPAPVQAAVGADAAPRGETPAEAQTEALAETPVVTAEATLSNIPAAGTRPAAAAPAAPAPVVVPPDEPVEPRPVDGPLATPASRSAVPASDPFGDESPAAPSGLPFGPSDTLPAKSAGSGIGAAASVALRSLLLLLLLTALVAQVALLLRNPLVQWLPQARPWVLQACAVLSCELAPVRALEAVAVDGSSLSFASETGNHRLRVFLRNSDDRRLETPALELSLIDAQGELLARRVFLPSQWDQPLAALAPAAEVAVDITLDLQGLEASAIASFRVLPLYP